MPETTVIYGAPGTGKTTWIEQEIKQMVDDKEYPLHRILYSTFNKAMAAEGQLRLIGEYPEHERVIERNFRTVHSICYRLARGMFGHLKVVNFTDRKQFAKDKGYPNPISHRSIKEEDDALLNSGATADYFDMHDTYWTKYPNLPMENAFYKFANLPARARMEEWVRFMGDWREWKVKHKVVDYIDMILICLKHKLIPDYDVIFIDEFQDTFPVMGEVIKIWAENSDKVYFAGDSFQCIYNFNGASPYNLPSIKADRTIILPKTWRLPKQHWDFALKWLRTVPKYYPINTVMAEDRECNFGGMRLDQLDAVVSGIEQSKTSCMILSRTNKQARSIGTKLGVLGVEYRMGNLKHGAGSWPTEAMHLVNAAMSNGVLYANEIQTMIGLSKPVDTYWKRGAVPRLMRNKDQMTKENLLERLKVPFSELLTHCTLSLPDTHVQQAVHARFKRRLRIKQPQYRQIQVGTIHSAKGTEADHVILDRCVGAKVLSNVGNSDPHENRRVFFVGLTRAKKSLFLLDSEKGVPYVT